MSSFNAKDWVGIPWKKYGSTRAGADCYGIVRMFYNELFKIMLPEFAWDLPTAHALIEKQITELKWTSVPIAPFYRGQKNLKLGDVLCFHQAHLGIYLGHGRFLHMRTGGKSAIDKLFPVYINRLRSVYRRQP